MDDAKSAAKPIFAMIMERIAADPGLSATRKHSLLTSIRCYARLLGQGPARMVFDLGGYTDAIANARPARQGIKKSRWANIRTAIRARPGGRCSPRWRSTRTAAR